MTKTPNEDEHQWSWDYDVKEDVKDNKNLKVPNPYELKDVDDKYGSLANFVNLVYDNPEFKNSPYQPGPIYPNTNPNNAKLKGALRCVRIMRWITLFMLCGNVILLILLSFYGPKDPSANFRCRMSIMTSTGILTMVQLSLFIYERQSKRANAVIIIKSDKI